MNERDNSHTPDATTPPQGGYERVVTHTTAQRLRRHAAMHLAIYTGLYVAVQNADEIARWRHTGEGGSMIPTVEACGEPPEEVHELPITSGNFFRRSRLPGPSAPELLLPPPSVFDAVDASVAEVESAAYDADPSVLDVVRNVGRWARYFMHPQETFTSRYSGITFTVYSDRADPGWSLNEEPLDFALHSHLFTDKYIQRDDLAFVVGCLHRRVRQDRAHEGIEYNLFIPASPETCIHGWLPEDRPSDDKMNEFCDQRGLTSPHLELELLWWSPVSERIMVITAGQFNQEQAAAKLTDLAAHEGVHMMLANEDVPYRFTPDERYAQSLDVIRRTVFPDMEPILTYDE